MVQIGPTNEIAGFMSLTSMVGYLGLAKQTRCGELQSDIKSANQLDLHDDSNRKGGGEWSSG
jgi:hypothetical protein